VQLTLPAATDLGRVYVIKNTDVGTVNVVADGTDTIDGKNTQPVKKLKAMTIVADGAGHWHVISSVT
jgi:hypothetical protein